jgi:NADH-quinone oxidoreductase subunit H
MMENVLPQLFHILIFPGFVFLVVFGLFAEFVDRKLYARLQNRVGPPILQPLADFVKLSAKQEILPREADGPMFRLMPVIALASTVTSFLYIPIWNSKALFAFEGDLIVVLYLLMIPTLTFFLSGIYSTSLFAAIGAMRVVTQLFAYEVPLFLALLSPALLAGTWSISGISAFFAGRPWWWCFDIPGFAIAILAGLGKLEKVPFDLSDAETEIVGGTFTEYSGRLLALFRLTVDIESVVVASLLAAMFLPFGLGLAPIAGFLVYLIKTFFVIVLMTVLRTIVARLRIDQMLAFCWKAMVPLAFLQIIVCIVLKGVLE